MAFNLAKVLQVVAVIGALFLLAFALRITIETGRSLKERVRAFRPANALRALKRKRGKR
jgi:hypothetical protein